MSILGKYKMFLMSLKQNEENGFNNTLKKNKKGKKKNKIWCIKSK